MKQDIKEISYNLSQAERIKAEKEQEKKLLSELKQDIKYTLLGFIEQYYQDKEDFFDILENEGIIREKTEQRINEITELVKKQVVKDDRYIIKKELLPKYRNYDADYISNLIEDSFIAEYKRFKQRKSEYKKVAEIKAVELIYKDLCDYYDYLQKQGYHKKAIMYVLDKDRADIIEELQQENKNIDFTDKQFKKALKEVNDKFTDDLTPQKPKARLPFGWKVFFTLKIFDKLKKHL